MCPCGVIAVTVTLAVEVPGSATNRPAMLPDGGTPGMTRRVDGDAVPGWLLELLEPALPLQAPLLRTT